VQLRQQALRVVDHVEQVLVKYGDPIAGSPNRKTGVRANRWSRPDSYQRRVTAGMNL